MARSLIGIKLDVYRAVEIVIVHHQSVLHGGAPVVGKHAKVVIGIAEN
jgi:hypothetical protein